MIRWIGHTGLNIGADFLVGIYFSIINILPFVFDNILYNIISEWKSIYIFPLSVSFCEFLSSFSPIANLNIYAYAHRGNIEFLQIISLFGCYFLSFIIALFSSILDYAIFEYKYYEKHITKNVYAYGIIIIIIYFYGIIMLLIPINNETYNILQGERSVTRDFTLMYNLGVEANKTIYIKVVFKATDDEADTILKGRK